MLLSSHLEDRFGISLHWRKNPKKRKEKNLLETFLFSGRKIKAKVFLEVPLAAPRCVPFGNWWKLWLLHLPETLKQWQSCQGVPCWIDFDGCEISFLGWNASNRLSKWWGVLILSSVALYLTSASSVAQAKLTSVLITLLPHSCRVKDQPSDWEQTETKIFILLNCLFCDKLSLSVSLAKGSHMFFSLSN